MKKFIKNLKNTSYDVAILPILIASIGIPLLLIVVVIALIIVLVKLIIKAKQKQDTKSGDTNKNIVEDSKKDNK